MKKNHVKFEYICPYCGNEAPYVLKLDKDVTCRYCHSKYKKEERVKVKITKN